MEGFQGMLNKYQYPFENVVFEGGSNRLLPFCGAVRSLEESGVWQQVKRLGGSGTGSIMASLLAVGFNSQQLETLFKDDLQGVIKDGGPSNCCLCCVNSGYNPGKSILKWLGSKFKECTGKADLTFADVQKRFSKELCIVATNLTEGGLEYHHVKTTPDLRVVDSVRMSLATPILMESVKNVNKTEARLKTENWFVEGGVLCNYPVHAYDGWWLSLDEDLTFLKKLPQLDSPVHDRFSSFNSKTIGFITCDEARLKMLPTKLRDQVEASESATRPQDSKLFKNIEKLASDKAKLESRYTTYSSLANQFVKILEESKKSKFDSFTRDDLRAILTKCQLTDDELHLLFGTSQADDIFRKFSTKDKKDVNVQDVYAFLEKARNIMHGSVVHVKSPKLNSNVEQLKALSDLLHVHNLKSYFLSNNKNIDRTVVIPTGYIDSKVPGKSLSKQDKQYLVEQGREATRYFLESYVKRVPLLKEEGGEKNSFSREDLKQFIDDDVSEVIDETDYLESYLEKVL